MATVEHNDVGTFDGIGGPAGVPPSAGPAQKVTGTNQGTWLPSALSAPRPLEGVKSKKRNIFEWKGAVVAVGQQEHEVASTSLSLSSRVAAVGPVGRAIVDVLLGSCAPRSGSVNRHDNLSVAHLGPHLVDKDTIEAALKDKPQVLVLSGAADDISAWASLFSGLVASEGLSNFKGAVVVCAGKVELIPEAFRTTIWGFDEVDEESNEVQSSAQSGKRKKKKKNRSAKVETVADASPPASVDAPVEKETVSKEVPAAPKIERVPVVKKAAPQLGMPRAPALPVSKGGAFAAFLANDSDSDEETESTLAPPSAAAEVDFIPDLDVGHQSSDPATWCLLQKARFLAKEIFLDDCRGMRRAGWKMTLLASDLEAGNQATLLGFILYRIEESSRGSCISVAKLAVPEEYRGYGYGRKLMDWAEDFAKQQPVPLRRFELVSLQSAVPFYEHLGFRRVRSIVKAGEKDDIFFPGQIHMERSIV